MGIVPASYYGELERIETETRKLDGGMTFIQGADSELTIEVWND